MKTPPQTMTDAEFNVLLAGPLHHPLASFTLTRLALALRAVVHATGEPGAQALRQHCQQRQKQDDENASLA